jgi:glucose-6-phosphate 1-dehydrogenase
MADDQPMRSLMRADKVAHNGSRPAVTPADPCAIVLFGATGDLAKRLVIPALYNLSRTGVLSEKFALIGVARAKGTAESWRDSLYDTLKGDVGNAASAFNIDHIDEPAWDRLSAAMSYVCGDASRPELHDALGSALTEVAKAHATEGNVIFYLAIADRLFGSVVEQLARAKLTEEQEAEDGTRQGWRRVVIEKPFGHSLDSARKLDAGVRTSLREDQIFRIDHFLGKDTVQGIMALRFANGMFEPIWNRDRIDQVQITMAETVGVETRGKFYEATGALRDMVPNHALSLLSLVAMEPPVGFDAESVRDRKADVFAAMPAADPAKAVRGQYGAGAVHGVAAKGYRQEPDVAPDSHVETYAALQLEIDNWRWSGVPFYIRTGKHMPERRTEIAIRFKPAPYSAFAATPVEALQPNWLVLSIAPDEEISLQFEVKRPGPAMALAAVTMDFRYDDWFPKAANVGYETLIHDVMTGDQTLFMSADMVEQGWRIVQPVLDAWAQETAAFPNYDSGSAGPKAADDLLQRSGRAWRPVAQASRSVV